MLSTVQRGAAFLGLAVVAAVAAPAVASFHFMQIEQVIGGVGGDTSAQAIQLRMRTGFQNQLQNARLVVRDASGSNPIVLCNMATPIAQTATGTRILIASAGFAARTSPAAAPNYTMTALIPVSYMPAGRLSFESDGGVIYWSVSWGGAAYTGPQAGDPSNDANGNFGPAFAGVLPSSGTQALVFPGVATAASTTNAADYALTAEATPAIFRNAAGTGFTVTPPPPACIRDYNGSGSLDGDDLADYIADYFDSTGIQPGFAGPIAIPGGFSGLATGPFTGFGTPCPAAPDVPQPNPWAAPANAYRAGGYKATVGLNNTPCTDPNGDDLADYISAFFNGCP